jgi:uncharacterized spore protein YtfJ
MAETLSAVIAAGEAGKQAGMQVLEKIFSAAHTRAVYGEPVVAGVYTVITASEVSAGGGFGFGQGVGPAAAGVPRGEGQEGAETSGGGGGGGGGGSTGRPVAVITIGPDGVSIKPVVDPTKIALAAVTAWAAMATMLARMRRRL